MLYAKKDKRGLFLTYSLLIIGSIIVLIPFYWMLSSSLKDPRYIFITPPQWFPDPVVFKNYSEALTMMPFGRYLLNTCIITFGSLIGQVLSSSIIAYGFARIRFPYKDLLFIILLSTLMLPMQVTLIPTFKI